MFNDQCVSMSPAVAIARLGKYRQGIPCFGNLTTTAATANICNKKNNYPPTGQQLYGGVVLMAIIAVLSCITATSCSPMQKAGNNDNNNIAARYALQAKPPLQLHCQSTGTGDTVRVTLKIPSEILPATRQILWQISWKEGAKKGMTYQSDILQTPLPPDDRYEKHFELIAATFPAPPTQTPKYLSVQLMLKSGKVFAQARQVLPPISDGSSLDYAFQMANNQNDSLLFDTYVKPNTALRLNYRQTYCPENIQVSYFKHSTRQLALPPHTPTTTPSKNKALLPGKPDSIFQTSNPVLLKQSGLYILQKSNDNNTFDPLQGKTILVTENDFPKITTPKDLIEALRYLTRNVEYEQLKNAPDPKAAADSFWLQRAGNFERGRKLIKEFYSRVQRANALFSDYREGWQTDMGLIYIIFGRPQAVYDKGRQQMWDYTRLAQESTLRFIFEQQQLPFGQSYTLQRNPDYKSAWNDAVYEWRKGIIQNPSGD